MALKLVYAEVQYILYFYYQKHRSYDGISKIQKQSDFLSKKLDGLREIYNYIYIT
jgi:hypothetical protein